MTSNVLKLGIRVGIDRGSTQTQATLNLMTRFSEKYIEYNFFMEFFKRFQIIRDKICEVVHVFTM